MVNNLRPWQSPTTAEKGVGGKIFKLINLKQIHKYLLICALPPPPDTVSNFSQEQKYLIGRIISGLIYTQHSLYCYLPQFVEIYYELSHT